MSPYIHSQSVLIHSRVQRQTGCQSSSTSLTALSAAFAISSKRKTRTDKLFPSVAWSHSWIILNRARTVDEPDTVPNWFESAILSKAGLCNRILRSPVQPWKAMRLARSVWVLSWDLRFRTGSFRTFDATDYQPIGEQEGLLQILIEILFGARYQLIWNILTFMKWVCKWCWKF